MCDSGLKIEAGECPGAEGEGVPEEGDNMVGDIWGLEYPIPPPIASRFWELISIVISGLLRSKCSPLVRKMDNAMKNT